MVSCLIFSSLSTSLFWPQYCSLTLTAANVVIYKLLRVLFAASDIRVHNGEAVSFQVQWKDNCEKRKEDRTQYRTLRDSSSNSLQCRSCCAFDSTCRFLDLNSFVPFLQVTFHPPWNTVMYFKQGEFNINLIMVKTIKYFAQVEESVRYSIFNF